MCALHHFAWELAGRPLAEGRLERYIVINFGNASEALGPFVWAAISRAREAAAGTLADVLVKSVATRARLD